MSNDSINNLIQSILNGNKRACSKAISIVENEDKEYEYLMKNIYKYTGNAYVVGVTGPPGAGKSTFTDKIVKMMRQENKKIGIIAVDPTSPFTKGAILGDRIRMSDLTLDKGVFIRSMGSRGSLGGLSKATQGAIKILDAYGCDYIFVETVGVGQSEIDIVKHADSTIIIMAPGLGDDIQAIKAGVMEIGDIFVINKGDKDGAKKTFLEVNMMLDFKDDWEFKPPVNIVISETGKDIDEVLKNLSLHREHLFKTKKITNKRLERYRWEIEATIQNEIVKKINKIQMKENLDELLQQILDKEVDPFTVGEKIYKSIIK